MSVRKCKSCGNSYNEDSIKMEQCEYCDEFYCIYCSPSHKEESH